MACRAQVLIEGSLGGEGAVAQSAVMLVGTRRRTSGRRLLCLCRAFDVDFSLQSRCTAQHCCRVLLCQCAALPLDDLCRPTAVAEPCAKVTVAPITRKTSLLRAKYCLARKKGTALLWSSPGLMPEIRSRAMYMGQVPPWLAML